MYCHEFETSQGYLGPSQFDSFSNILSQTKIGETQTK